MDPHKILGVKVGASKDEIHKAYREKVSKHHPDMGGDGWAFQQVQQAYELLVEKVPGKSPQPAATPPEPTSMDVAATNEQAAQPAPYSKPRAKSKRAKTNESERELSQLFVGDLPLRDETNRFIFANCLDIFMTYILLRFGAIEANPIADYFMQMWGFNGMIAFKLGLVAFVCLIAQIVALKKLNTAKWLLNGGTILVGVVVVYSVSLFFLHYK